ncbi:MAG: GTP-binding protein [Lachnospiraceae bacterium]|nr:GTP-binding protein [Lachnospiraceae bacterium]
MTKIDIISGFLGAGKTTLIKKLLDEGLKGEKLVLIENEFGEIGIDGGFLKDAGVEITEMNSGCICCSLVGDFGTALKEVIDKYAPDRIIIEPSGVGKLSDVIKAVNGIMEQEPDIALNSTTAVVDGLKTKMYMKNFGEFFNNQVESAGTIVISRTQKQPEQALKEVVALLKEHNPNATVITTPWEEINGKQILSAMEKTGSLAEELLAEAEVCPECGHHHEGEGSDHHHHHEGECCGHGHEHHHKGECHDHDHHHEGECCGHGHNHHHEGECCGHGHNHHHEGECCGHNHEHEHHHHHADEVFTSWGAETPRKYMEEEVRTALEKLADTEEYGVILRAKGMLPNVNGEWIYFDMVPGEYEIRTGSPEYTGRICVIGTKPDEDKLKELFCLNS